MPPTWGQSGQRRRRRAERRCAWLGMRAFFILSPLLDCLICILGSLRPCGKWRHMIIQRHARCRQCSVFRTACRCETLPLRLSESRQGHSSWELQPWVWEGQRLLTSCNHEEGRAACPANPDRRGCGGTARRRGEAVPCLALHSDLKPWSSLGSSARRLCGAQPHSPGRRGAGVFHRGLAACC